MKKISFSLAVLILSASLVMAQPTTREHASRRAHPLQEKMYQHLNLTADQQAKIKQLDETFKKDLQALHQDEGQTVKQLREKRAALVQSHSTQVENVLTATQKAALATLKKDIREKRQEGRTRSFEKWQQALGLTDQQLSQLKADQEATRLKRDAIRQDQQLDRTARMEKMKALREENKNRLDRILTPEQKTKWEGMKKERFKHRPKHLPMTRQAPPAA